VVVTDDQSPGMIMAAERDYHAMCGRLAWMLLGVRLMLAQRITEVEVATGLYRTLQRAGPGMAARIGAAAIVQLAQQSGTDHPAIRPSEAGQPDS
jgi:hypothetical protein